ncbi:DegV family protein [Salsuginibacillus kocurii]|uniref:DegV family protein n=1 Tax=Salsuginibacillus kocurii TaxID=427078 RepID=UPI000363AFDB|nr:DegV family protein [Salsuginibacillus kocurii]
MATKWKIITDSTADLPEELVKELDITVVPLKVIFGQEETFYDRINLMPEEFYEKLREADQMPTTSQPSPHEFETVYRKLHEESEAGTKLVSLHLSSQLSGTYQAAQIAADQLSEEGLDIKVVDTKRASCAVGIIVKELAQMVQAGVSPSTCEERLQELLEKTEVYFIVDTLEFLQKNGRIGKASALLGSLLKMKPILSLTADGEVYPLEKVRGRKKALQRLGEILREKYGTQPVETAISHAEVFEQADSVLATAKENVEVVSVMKSSIGPVIGAHVGPGALAIAVAPAKNN